MKVKLPNRIKSVSGKYGCLIFYIRNGRQFVRRTSRDIEPSSNRYRTVIEALSSLNIKIQTKNGKDN